MEGGDFSLAQNEYCLASHKSGGEISFKTRLGSDKKQMRLWFCWAIYYPAASELCSARRRATNSNHPIRNPNLKLAFNLREQKF